MGIVNRKSAVTGALAACLALAPTTAFAMEADNAAEMTGAGEIEVTVMQPEVPSVHEGNIVGTATVMQGASPTGTKSGKLPATGDQLMLLAMLGGTATCMAGGTVAMAKRKRNEER